MVIGKKILLRLCLYQVLCRLFFQSVFHFSVFYAYDIVILNVFAFSEASFLCFVREALKFLIRSRDLRKVSPSQLQQCASSNVVGLVGTLLAFCLYCYSLSTIPNTPCTMSQVDNYHYYRRPSAFNCPTEVIEVS